MRFRPLRTASAPRHRARRRCPTRPPRCAPPSSSPPAIRARSTRHPSPVPSPVLSELLVRVVAAGINPIDAKTRAGSRVSPARSARTPRCSATTSAASWCARPTSPTPSPRAPPVFGMAAVPPLGRHLRRVRGRAVALRRPQARLALARRGRGRPARGAHRVGTRRRDRARARGPADPDPRRQRRRRATSRCSSPRTSVRTSPSPASARNAPWLRELGASVVVDYTTTRFEDVIADVDVVIDLVGNVRDDTGTRSLEVLRPGGLYILVPTGSWPGYADAQRMPRACASTSYKVVPDGGALATVGAAARLRCGAGLHRQGVRPARCRRRPRRARTRPHPRQDRAARQRRLTALPPTGREHPSALRDDLVGDRVEQLGAQVPLLPVQGHVDGRAARASPARPALERVRGLEPRQQRPAEAEPHRRSRSRSMRARSAGAARRRVRAARAQPPRLQIVAAVEVDDGRLAERVRVGAGRRTIAPRTPASRPPRSASPRAR